MLLRTKRKTSFHRGRRINTQTLTKAGLKSDAELLEEGLKNHLFASSYEASQGKEVVGITASE